MTLLEKIQKLNDKDFKQLVGVKRKTFLEMVNIRLPRKIRIKIFDEWGSAPKPRNFL